MISANVCRDRRGRHGFTMIEVMAAILLTSIVISVAVAFQINLGAATMAARERLRTQRQAIALLDRIARDLAGAYFIASPANASGGSNPWIFLSARHFTEEGNSDAIKFITRNYRPQGLDGHHSDLAVVAYYLKPVEDGSGYQLMRWRRTHMPQVYDPRFPELDDPDADIIGENLASFALSMIDETGEEHPEWDSRGKQGRQSLPVGVTIEIAMLDPNQIASDADANDFERDQNDLDDFDTDEEAELQTNTYSKTVILPLRPLDWTFLESEARAAAGATDSDEQGEEEKEDVDEADDDGDEFNDDSDEGFDSFNFNPEPNRALARARTNAIRAERRVTA